MADMDIQMDERGGPEMAAATGDSKQQQTLQAFGDASNQPNPDKSKTTVDWSRKDTLPPEYDRVTEYLVADRLLNDRLNLLVGVAAVFLSCSISFFVSVAYLFSQLNVLNDVTTTMCNATQLSTSVLTLQCGANQFIDFSNGYALVTCPLGVLPVNPAEGFYQFWLPILKVILGFAAGPLLLGGVRYFQYALFSQGVIPQRSRNQCKNMVINVALVVVYALSMYNAYFQGGSSSCLTKNRNMKFFLPFILTSLVDAILSVIPVIFCIQPILKTWCATKELPFVPFWLPALISSNFYQDEYAKSPLLRFVRRGVSP